MTIADLIAGLSRPEAYPHARDIDRVEVRQTHVSALFFAGDLVYKVKKPVDLGFLDFTTLESRRHFCHEEVRLNRRLAPRTYLGVAGITRRPDGALSVAEPGDEPEDAVDFAVVMRRLPESRMLDRLLDEGRIDNAVLDELVAVLLRFHDAAATGEGVDEHGSPEAVARAVLDNLERTRPFVTPRPGRGGTLSPALFARLDDSARSFLDGHHALLERRVAEGRIRDGHGDLHAGNICLTDEGFVIYDCIEFSPALRCGDVVKDLAFLIMDLDARGLRGLRGFGRYLARRYADATGDGDFRTLLPFYKTHFACVRGMVNSIAAAEADRPADMRDVARAEAMRYFHLAAAYNLPPALILTCGLPGTGKSWVAAHAARPFEAAVIRSDVVRKRLAGVAPTHRPSPAEAAGLYSAGMGRRTYETMLEETGRFLDEGRTVVADATFARAAHRAPFVALARRRHAPLVIIHTTCPEPIVAERMGRRSDDADEVSDADWEVYLQFKQGFEPPDEVEHVVEADTTGTPEVIVAALIDRLL